MATLNFPDDPSTGDVYTDSNSGFTYEWNGTVWISTDPSTASNIREIDDISGDFDGSDTDFTLKVSAVNVEPVNAQQLIISVGGVMQNAGDDFTVSGSTITFTTPPQSGLSFFGTLLGTALSLNTIADGTVTPSSLTTTSNYVMNGLTLDQGAGIITAFGFQGGSITADLDSTFSGNVSIAGSLTVQGTQTIINVDELNIQDKTIGIGSTNAPSSTSQDGAGAIIYGQTHIDILYDREKASLGISTGVTVTGFVTATEVNAGTFTAPADLIITTTGASAIRPRTDQFTVKNAANNETLFYADANSAFAAYYDNTKRFETASDDAGGGVIVTGKIVGTAVTANDSTKPSLALHTGTTRRADFAANSGITSIRSFSNSPFAINIGGSGETEALRIDSSGRLMVGTTIEGNDDADELTLNGTRTGLTIRSASNDYGNIFFSDATSGTSEYAGAVQYYHNDDSLIFKTSSTNRFTITSNGGFSFDNAQLVERVEITAGKLSNNTDIDLADGMVHYFSTTETGTSTPNIRIDGSNTLNNAMDTGDVISVTLITTAAAAAYSAALNIDGSSATVEWSGAAAPSAGGASGLDVYAYTIIKTGSGAYKVLGNYTNFD